MKKIGLTKFLIHVYVWASAFALLTFANQDVSRPLFAIGANSWLIALGVGSDDNTSKLVSALLFHWWIVFPILLIIFYIVACKKDLYIPFCVIATIDSIISLSWFIYCATNHTSWHKYAMETMQLDAIISIIYSMALVISIKRDKDGGLLEWE